MFVCFRGREAMMATISINNGEPAVLRSRKTQHIHRVCVSSRCYNEDGLAVRSFSARLWVDAKSDQSQNRAALCLTCARRSASMRSSALIVMVPWVQQIDMGRKEGNFCEALQHQSETEVHPDRVPETRERGSWHLARHCLGGTLPPCVWYASGSGKTSPGTPGEATIGASIRYGSWSITRRSVPSSSAQAGSASKAAKCGDQNDVVAFIDDPEETLTNHGSAIPSDDSYSWIHGFCAMDHPHQVRAECAIQAARQVRKVNLDLVDTRNQDYSTWNPSLRRTIPCFALVFLSSGSTLNGGAMRHGSNLPQTSRPSHARTAGVQGAEVPVCCAGIEVWLYDLYLAVEACRGYMPPVQMDHLDPLPERHSLLGAGKVPYPCHRQQHQQQQQQQHLINSPTASRRSPPRCRMARPTWPCAEILYPVTLLHHPKHAARCSLARI
nr:hypothetical protein CFP56_41263 [Quercus suber]